MSAVIPPAPERALPAAGEGLVAPLDRKSVV